MNKRKIIYFVFFISLFSSVFTQTEKDYYEWIRRHNETRKIKKIITDYYTDYINEQGYHIKREYNDGGYCLITWLSDGNITAEKVTLSATLTNTKNPSLLYYCDFTYNEKFDNAAEKVELQFDIKNKLIEKVIHSESDLPAREKYYYEVLRDYPSRSEFYSEGSLVTTTYYKYDGKGILLNESLRDEYSGKTYFFEYKYEFYE